MEQPDHGRRKFVASAIGAGTVPTAVLAQGGEGSGDFFNAFNSGRYHSAAVREVRGKLREVPPSSPEGLAILINALVEANIIEPEEGAVLNVLATVIRKSTTKKDVETQLDALTQKVRNNAESVALSLIRIARDSADTAWDFVRSNDERIAQVILKDFSGGLTAVVGAFPFVKDPRVLVGIAVAGAVAASINAIYDN
jgi:hypothetical protein